MNDTTTRERIVAAADMLFYRRGFDHTSFADIADAVGISRGNFYYHFRAKDEILDAVIEARLENTRAMLKRWEAEADDPAARIRCFINILVANRADIRRYGCPVGTLTAELAKLNHDAHDEARALFTLFRSWLRKQFRALGRKADADALAMHLLSRSQGAATLASAFGSEALLRREAEEICRWLDARVAETARPGRQKNRRKRNG